MAKFTSDRKLWLTADRNRVVEDGDPDAAFLLAVRGDEIDAETAQRYGLGAKAVKGPPEDKALKAPATKNKE